VASETRRQPSRLSPEGKRAGWLPQSAARNNSVKKDGAFDAATRAAVYAPGPSSIENGARPTSRVEWRALGRARRRAWRGRKGRRAPLDGGGWWATKTRRTRSPATPAGVVRGSKASVPRLCPAAPDGTALSLPDAIEAVSMSAGAADCIASYVERLRR